MSSDLRALGRLGASLDGGAAGGRRRRRVSIRRGPGPARRRPPVPRSLVVGAVVVAVALTWVGLAASRAEEAPTPPPGTSAATDVPSRAVHDDPRASRGEGRARPATTFARVDDLPLTLPFADPVLVAFGEGLRAEALALQPVGRLTANEHHRFEPISDVRGPDYLVLASAGRPRAPTSGVDVVIPVDAPAVAPVTGQVVGVREYAMEGGVRDFRVTIEAADRPSLHVVVAHLRQPTVAEGDLVHAGSTPLGTVRSLPFSRGVDAHLDEPLPHVHLEVKPAGQPTPPDPNEPAVVPAAEPAGGR